VAAVGLLAAGVARAGDAPAAKDGWTAFKPGSSVTTRTVMRMGGDAGDQPPQESRTTLVSVSDKEYVLRSEVKLAGEWQGKETTVPRAAPESGDAAQSLPAEAVGEEKLTIDGQEFACKKMKTVSQGTTTINWTYQDKDVLKSESTGPGDRKTTFVVTALRKKVTVAGKELLCRETKSTVKTETSENSSTSVTSESLPGGLVRSETLTRSIGMAISSVTDVIAFEVK
jgi:hypothetical protein